MVNTKEVSLALFLAYLASQGTPGPSPDPAIRPPGVPGAATGPHPAGAKVSVVPGTGSYARTLTVPHGSTWWILAQSGAVGYYTVVYDGSGSKVDLSGYYQSQVGGGSY